MGREFPVRGPPEPHFRLSWRLQLSLGHVTSAGLHWRGHVVSTPALSWCRGPAQSAGATSPAQYHRGAAARRATTVISRSQVSIYHCHPPVTGQYIPLPSPGHRSVYITVISRLQVSIYHCHPPVTGQLVNYPFKIEGYNLHIMCTKDEEIVMPNFAALHAAVFPLSTKNLPTARISAPLVGAQFNFEIQLSSFPRLNTRAAACETNSSCRGLWSRQSVCSYH